MGREHETVEGWLAVELVERKRRMDRMRIEEALRLFGLGGWKLVRVWLIARADVSW